MFTFAKSDLQRLAISAVGAVALTATCVGAAVAPAGAAAVPGTIDAWQDKVESQIELGADPMSLRMEPGKRAEAVLAIRFTAAGDYAGAALARSTGDARLDRHALRVASAIKYPPLPQSLHGAARTVAMRIFFGRADTPSQYAEMQRDVESVKLAAARGAAETVAAK